MYGFIHTCLQDLIVKQFGQETWDAIIKEAGVNLKGGEYVIHRTYSDTETMKLVTTAQRLSGIPLNDILEIFGNHFYYYCVDSGYARILRILGRTLQEFLCNLDALHDHLAAIYPGMNAPSFRTTKRIDGGIDLHYYSNRKGLGPIVVGIMKTVARECLNTEIEIRVDREEDEIHTVFVVYEKTKPINSPTIPLRNSYPVTRESSFSSFKTFFKRKKHFMSVQSFAEAFPFHVVFDRSLNIRQCGASISKYVDIQGYSMKKKKKIINSKFTDSFRLIRPKMNFTFESVMDHINTVFIVSSINRIGRIGRIERSTPTHNTKGTAGKSGSIIGSAVSATSLCATAFMGKQQVTQELKLKGQMIYLPKSDCILFLCSPRVSSLEELERRGLYLSDIPLHDATREVILTNKEHHEDRELVKKIEDSNNGLKILQSKLVYNKQVTDDLLHELLPPNVVSQLRFNLSVLAESYEVVTILFSDLVGFTALCSNERVVPMDIIKLLNKLYTMFDVISNMYNIYKVETIGDAYMGVCGIPSYFEDHAERVAKMGMDMLECVKNVISPVDSHPVRIRVGLHSGCCMAGVVGKKTPRYCLFGRTVTIANKMESGSSPGRVNVSADTKKFLNPEDWTFEENTNENPVECFFLKKSGENLKRDVRRSMMLKDLATVETHLKSDSPNLRKKEISNDTDKITRTGGHNMFNEMHKDNCTATESPSNNAIGVNANINNKNNNNNNVIINNNNIEGIKTDNISNLSNNSTLESSSSLESFTLSSITTEKSDTVKSTSLKANWQEVTVEGSSSLCSRDYTVDSLPYFGVPPVKSGINGSSNAGSGVSRGCPFSMRTVMKHN